MKELPSGWTVEDVVYLLLELKELDQILVADHQLGIPTIHEIRGAEHCGFGVFVAQGENEYGRYEVSFCGGGAMSRTPSGHGWTFLAVNRGKYPYDTEAARQALIEYLPESHYQVILFNDPEPRFETDSLYEAVTEACRFATIDGREYQVIDGSGILFAAFYPTDRGVDVLWRGEPEPAEG